MGILRQRQEPVQAPHPLCGRWNHQGYAFSLPAGELWPANARNLYVSAQLCSRLLSINLLDAPSQLCDLEQVPFLLGLSLPHSPPVKWRFGVLDV